MKLSLNRYTPDMLLAISKQSLPSLFMNVLVRSIVFVGFLQLLAWASGQQTSSGMQILFLLLIFGFILASIDVIEKYWAVERLKRRS